MITREKLIEKYLSFYESKDHKRIPSASLVPENDPTVLFTTAGMHPLVPYLMGQKHPLGKRLVNIQKCIRTGDIEEVGNSTHHTFFEMMGNWSLGDYFKTEAIEYTFEFLTKTLNIPIENLAVTCFEGNKNAKKDTEAEKTWLKLGIPKERIAFLDKKENWWETPNPGPCGPDTEIFYWTSSKPAPKKFNPKDNLWVEIGNNVLMQYQKTKEGKYVEAKQKNIDFGGGVERILTVLNGFEDNYETEIWQPLIKEIEKLSNKKYENTSNKPKMRIIADHIKASIFIISDGVVPGNSEQGYVLRRLIRRAIRYSKKIGIPQDKDLTTPLVKATIKIYKKTYPELEKNKQRIINELNKEEEKFEKTLDKGLKSFNHMAKIIEESTRPMKNAIKAMENQTKKTRAIMKVAEESTRPMKNAIKAISKSMGPTINTMKNIQKILSANNAFLLYQSYGFPIEMTEELAKEKGIKVDTEGFGKELKKHQVLSQTASAGMFKSGLADNSEQTTRLHTSTHLLLAALKIVLGKDINQKGSNITPDRLRLDFSFDRKLTDKEKQEVEDLVNKEITKKTEIIREEISPAEAKKKGATGMFDGKYPDIVSVYTIGNFSKEICTGPHVKNTSEMGKFKIQKEQSSSSGVRRIKAVLE